MLSITHFSAHNLAVNHNEYESIMVKFKVGTLYDI